ncbi:MAG: hypothetical protein Q4D02_02270 [Clostridia bacterium]|nr:hypothetical protein [Clostridia bacterium]
MIEVDVLKMVELIAGKKAKELVETYRIKLPKLKIGEEMEDFIGRVGKFCIQADNLAGISYIVEVNYINIRNHSNSIKAMIGSEQNEKLHQFTLPTGLSMEEAIKEAHRLREETHAENERLYHMDCHQKYVTKKNALEKALTQATDGDVVILKGNYPFTNEEIESKKEVFEEDILKLREGEYAKYFVSGSLDCIAFRKGKTDLAYILKCWNPIYTENVTHEIRK